MGIREKHVVADEGSGVKLNLGCGIRYREGFTNIDIAATEGHKAPDILADLRAIPLDDACAEEAMAIHVLEHFARWEVDEVLHEWHRLLKSGGLLILELPDVMKCARALLEGRPGKHPDQLSYWGLYGSPLEKNPWMLHKWGWHSKTLRPVLKQHGFTDIQEKETQWHPAGRLFRDFRLEARKP